jgi:hypothetical protein
MTLSLMVWLAVMLRLVGLQTDIPILRPFKLYPIAKIAQCNDDEPDYFEAAH